MVAGETGPVAQQAAVAGVGPGLLVAGPAGPGEAWRCRHSGPFANSGRTLTISVQV